ncbi:MAG: RNA-guided endonuclease TnpB family protein [Candidatus Paceibacterota bacterium]|jgi:putative transposase
MFKVFKYRLYPSEPQKQLLDKHFGCVRLIYNLALETKTNAYSVHKINLSRYDLQVQLKDLKEDCTWLRDVNSQSLQFALMNLDTAYGNFFKGRTMFPNFKKKSNKQSFHCPQRVTIENNHLYIPKFKDGIRIILHRPIVGVIKSATISKTPTGKYFASILCETRNTQPSKIPIDSTTAVGIDLGLKTFAVLSDGTVFENPKHLRNSLKRLKVLSRMVSHKIKGSNNRKKTNKRIAKLYEKITNQRNDFLHKVSDAITKQYDIICIEDLSVKNMVKNHSLALSINDSGWGKFVTFLKYKSEWRGKNIIEIGRFDPSSKMHNKCGYINKELTLTDRTWRCPKCGNIVLRDINAACNILDWGLLKYSGVERPGELLEFPTLVGTMKEEKFITS